MIPTPLRDSIAAELGADVVATASLSGGCINQAYQVELKSGDRFFVKSNRVDQLTMFEAEEFGLAALASDDAIRIPKPIASGVNKSCSYLILEWIDSGKQDSESSSRLGEQLAQLHANTVEAKFGFDRDNFLGATFQPNPWSESWPDFFIRNRLEYQFQLAAKNGFRELRSASEKVFLAAEKRLRNPGESSLIHGDLWGGNYLIDRAGEAVLFDPAPYRVDREAEFGILTMFGGFDQAFFDAYQSVFPLEDGYEERLPLYQLYHYLNHLNLFGSGYMSDCQRLINGLY